MAFLAWQPWDQSSLPGSFCAAEGSSRNLVCPWSLCLGFSRAACQGCCAWADKKQRGFGNPPGKWDCIGKLPGFCQSIVKIIPFSECVFFVSGQHFQGKKTKKSPQGKQQKKVGKFSSSNQPNGRMLLVFTSLQKEVSKPTLHFTQGHNETEEGEGEQRHLAPLRSASPQSDPRKKMLLLSVQDYKHSAMTSWAKTTLLTPSKQNQPVLLKSNDDHF